MELPADFAGGEGDDDVVGRNVIGAGRGRAADDRVEDHAGHRVRGPDANQRDGRIAADGVFTDGVIPRAETQPRFIVQNDQRRARLRAGQDVDKAAEQQAHRPVAFQCVVRNDRHAQLLARLALREDQGSQYGQVIHPGLRGPALREGVGARLARGAATTAHGDNGVGAGFADDELRQGKFQAAGAGNRAAVNAANMLARLVVVFREAAPEHDAAVRLDDERSDEGVGPVAEVDRRVGRAVRVEEACDAPARHAVERFEITCDEELAVHLLLNGIDRVVRTGQGGRGEEVRIKRAGLSEPREETARDTVDVRERTAKDDETVRLDEDGAHRRINRQPRIEAGVERAVRVQPDEVGPGHAVEGDEFAADQHLAVVLHRERIDAAVEARAGHERGVHHAVRVQPHQAGPRDVVEGVERAAHEHLVVRLHREGEDRVVRAGPGIEGEIHLAVGREARDAVAVGAVDGREQSAEQQLALAGQGQRANRAVGSRTDVKGAVQLAVRLEARDAVARHAADLREITGHDQTPVKLPHQRIDRRVGSRLGAEGGVERAGGRVDGFIVHDLEHGVGDEAEHRVDRVEERDLDRLVPVRHGVINDLHLEGFAEFTGLENKCTARVLVIHARHGNER